MPFDPTAYGPEVARILALDGNGERLMPLVQTGPSSSEAQELVRSVAARELFPASRAPEAALAGLFLYFGCWDDAHKVAQDINTPEGSFWHAIVHRQEPDASNSSYWFRQAGTHPIFPQLAHAASLAKWDPFDFIRICEEAVRNPGSEKERKALETQRAEWQLLFDYCARRA